MKAGSKIVRLGDIADVQSGGTPLISNKSFWSGDIPWYSSGELNGFYTTTPERHISDAGLEGSNAKLFPAGSLLIGMYDTAALKMSIIDRAAAFNQAIAGVRPNDKIDLVFVLYAINSMRDQILSQRRGVRQKNLSLEKVRSIELILPPLHEQQRIVAILDEAFAAIAKASANAEKNLQNARELFESHLHAVLHCLGEECEQVTLQTLLERGWIEGHLDGNHGGDYPRKEEFISEGVPYISANCLDDEQVDMSRAKYLSPARASMLRKGIAKNQDVLFAHNATVGPVALLSTNEEKVILGTSLTYYRCNQKHILPEYLAHYMRSSDFKSQYEQVMKQSTRNQVPITKQREFFHVIPPIDEQEKIIGSLNGLFEKGRELESIYQQKLAALDELKKSLLHKAFAGEL